MFIFCHPSQHPSCPTPWSVMFLTWSEPRQPVTLSSQTWVQTDLQLSNNFQLKVLRNKMESTSLQNDVILKSYQFMGAGTVQWSVRSPPANVARFCGLDFSLSESLGSSLRSSPKWRLWQSLVGRTQSEIDYGFRHLKNECFIDTN